MGSVPRVWGKSDCPKAGDAPPLKKRAAVPVIRNRQLVCRGQKPGLEETFTAGVLSWVTMPKRG